MTSPIAVEKPKRKSLLGVLAWWRRDESEIERQVRNYDTLKFTQSARGMSLICCLFSVALTVVLGGLLNLSSETIAWEVVVWAPLGFFMYRGHRWAFIGGMILWTVEKGAQLPAIQALIFWAIYMHVFLLGLRVEQRRRVSLPGPAVAAQ